MYYKVRTEILADAECVWSVIADLAKRPSWTPPSRRPDRLINGRSRTSSQGLNSPVGRLPPTISTVWSGETSADAGTRWVDHGSTPADGPRAPSS